MKRSRPLALFACLALAIAAFIAFTPAETKDRIVASVQNTVEQIRGNAPMEQPAGNEVYAVLAMPQNYESDPKLVALSNSFAADENLVAMRRSVNFWAYRADQSDFKHRWAQSLPEVQVGKPALLIMQGDQVVYKKSGDNLQVAQVSADVGRLLPRWRHCPTCPDQRRPGGKPPIYHPSRPAVDVDVDVNPGPVVPAIPDTPSLVDVDVDSQEEPPLFAVGDNSILAIASLAGGLALGWVIAFRRGM